MPVLRWDPLGELNRELDRLLETMRLPLRTEREPRELPVVNVYETEFEFLLTAELPGVPPEKVDVTVIAGTMTIQAERGAPEGVAPEQFRRHERPGGKWLRSLTIPDRVDESLVAAEFIDGVLKVHLPKLAAPPPRQIPVHSGT